MAKSETNSEKKSSLKDYLSKPLIVTDSRTLQYSGLGIQLTVTILIFLFIGIWLDKVFETKFIFTLVLTLMGFGGGFYNFFLTIQKLSAQDKKDREDKQRTEKLNQQQSGKGEEGKF